jgi:hypothetical protein
VQRSDSHYSTFKIYDSPTPQQAVVLWKSIAPSPAGRDASWRVLSRHRFTSQKQRCWIARRRTPDGSCSMQRERHSASENEGSRPIRSVYSQRELPLNRTSCTSSRGVSLWMDKAGQERPSAGSTYQRQPHRQPSVSCEGVS